MGKNEVSFTLIAFASALVSSVLLVVNLLSELRNPNANLSANRADAWRLLRGGRIVLEQEGTNVLPTETPRSKSFSPIWIAAVVLQVVGVPALMISEGVRVMRGWPMNKGFHPPVIGLGDVSRFYLPHSIDCITHHWRATNVVIKCTNAEELGNPSLTFAAKTAEDWSSTIEIWKSRSESERSLKRSHPSIWLDILIPAVDRLVGKKEHLVVDMDVVFAVAVGASTFENRTTHLSHQTTVTIASQGAGEIYTTLWWWGIILGWLLQAAGSLVLYSTARRMKSRIPVRCFAA